MKSVSQFRLFIFVLITLLISSACSGVSLSTAEVQQIITSPTPVPTATPSPLDKAISDFSTSMGISEDYIFGLSGEDWINLFISALLVSLGVIISNRLLIGFLNQITRKTKTPWDEEFLREIESQIRWFVIVFFTQYAIMRLAFLPSELKQYLNMLFFSLYVFIGVSILWKFIDFAGDYYQKQFANEDITKKPEVVITLIQRLARAVLLSIGTIVVLKRLGIDVNALIAALGIGGLAISLAAQDTLADAINGFIILVDQPFRVGDRIEIQDLDTWGDVIEIGTRTTRIRTRDNRLVIIPNSKIGKSQVVNYTYPDPRYRIQMEIEIAYGTDVEYVRKLIVDTLRKVDGVLLDKPVDALYIAMGESAMTFLVRWWIKSFADTRWIFDQVNTALQNVFDTEGIELPFVTYDVNVKYKDEGEGTKTLAVDDVGDEN